MIGDKFLREKLVHAVQVDYPHASEILVSFPDKWELIQKLEREGLPHTRASRTVYIAAWPPSEERAYKDHFVGLSEAINLSLTSYRMYKFFQPWPQPHITVAWDIEAGQGEVIGGGPLTVQLQPIGQAQVWYGPEVGVLWEAYIHQPDREEGWQELLADIWQVVEQSMGVGKIFTMSHDPAFPKAWYRSFLKALGYGPTEAGNWWSKEVAREQAT